METMGGLKLDSGSTATVSGTSIDGGTESNQFMSFPGTPAADDDDDGAFFWKGESVPNYLVFWWLISAAVLLDPRP